MTDIELTALLYEALNSTHGVCIQTSAPEKLKQRLYVIRADLRKKGNLDFDKISFRTSPFNPEEEIWLVQKAISEKGENPGA